MMAFYCVLSFTCFVLVDPPKLENARFVVGNKTDSSVTYTFVENDLYVTLKNGSVKKIADVWRNNHDYAVSSDGLVVFPRMLVDQMTLWRHDGTSERYELSEARPYWAIDLADNHIYAAGFDGEALYMSLFNESGSLLKKHSFDIQPQIDGRNKVFSVYDSNRNHWIVWSAISHEFFFFDANFELFDRRPVTIPVELESFERDLMMRLNLLYSDSQKHAELADLCEKNRNKPLMIVPTAFFTFDKHLVCAWRYQKLTGCIKGSSVEADAVSLLTYHDVQGRLLNVKPTRDHYVLGRHGDKELVTRRWRSEGGPGEGKWTFQIISEPENQ